MSDEEKKLVAWFERLRMVARSSTASNIEPWDIGAFLLALHEWTLAQERMPGAFGGRLARCNGCGIDNVTNTHHVSCPIHFLEVISAIDPKDAVRP